MKWSVWGDSLRSLHDRKARSYPGVPKHILGRLSGKCGMCPSFLFGSRHCLYIFSVVLALQSPLAR